MTALTLRPYQSEAIDRSGAAERRGVRRQLIVAATGLGKTVIFCSLAEQRRERVLVLAHRDELISQAVAKVREIWPDANIGVVKADRNEVLADVVVASVQTLARPKRLAELLAPFDPAGVTLLGRAEPFGLVVVDEAHHATATSYRGVLDALHAGDDDGPLLLGVTATPDRGDGKGLNDLFDEIVASYDLLWGIAHGYLSELRGLRVRVEDLDLSKVKVSKGDYEAGAAGKALEDADASKWIVQAWMEHANGRRTLVFTPTVHTAQLVADEFNRNGIPAGFVHGGTPLDERRELLRAYSAGELDVLANCAVLTEGYDEPRTDCIIMARPTRSRALYTQCVGRGARRHPDKQDCLVLDVVGASVEHSLVTIPSLFGLKGKHAEQMHNGGSRLSEAVAAFEEEQIRAGLLRAEEAELFHKVRATGIAWVPVHHDGDPLKRYVRPMPDRELYNGRKEKQPTVVLAQRTEDLWTAGLLHPDGSKRALIVEVPFELAQGVAEDWVRSHTEATALTDADAAWRKRRPTPKALAAARKWHLAVDPKWNAGELSDALNAHVTRIQMRKLVQVREKAMAG